MSGKDAEIERAFERAERDKERRALSGAVYTYPILTFSEHIPCPACGGPASFKMKCDAVWYAVCCGCPAVWALETDNERENDG